ncbi:MAG TPA: SAM-dependent methyltransferase [Micromonosporaceae bacterium]|nr:SAM-dependent methyltransferase [Micromonosporaceae bacterium]
MQRPSWAPEGVDIDRPSPARLYDYALGGVHNFAVDRQLYHQVVATMPDLALHARVARAFMRRAVRFCAEAGLRQFLDLGSGIPTRGNVHEVVQRAAPEARVMYVDIDPVAVAHSREILTGNPLARVIQADLRKPDTILNDPDVRDLLDLDQPVAVLMVNVLHFVLEDPTGIVTTFRDAVVPGSPLVISTFTTDTRPEQMATSLGMLRQRGAIQTAPRTPAEVERLFTGFELVEPGLVWAHEWRPDPPVHSGEAVDRPIMLGGVGLKT